MTGAMLPYPLIMKVSILGSGDLGATVAQKLACSDWPGEIWLLDTDAGAAKGRALDLMESNPVLRSDTAVYGSEQTNQIENSGYIIVADMGGLNPGSISASDAGKLLSTLERADRDAVILVAVSDPAALFTKILKSARVDPRRVFGTSPEALASLWRHYIGRRYDCSPQDVQVSILGAPPRSGLYEVFASIGGQAIDRLLSPAEIREVALRVSRRLHPGPRTLASAAVTILRDMIQKIGAVRSCYLWTEGAYGARNLFLCAPAIFGPMGVSHILEFRLEPRQEVTVSRALDSIAGDHS